MSFQKTYKRPRLISILCIIGYIMIVLSLPSIFSPETRKLGNLFPALLGFIVALRFISFVGIWHMKRWGVELFIYTFLGGLIISEWTGTTSYFIGLPMNIIGIATMLPFYKRMDKNL